MRYSRVCVKLVDLSMVPLLDRSRPLSECESLNNKKTVNRNLEVNDHNSVLFKWNDGLRGRFVGKA